MVADKCYMYEVFLKSFKDSNGDGYDDLRGQIENLDYFDKIGVKILWLTPIYPCGGLDCGYDVTSFVDIDPLYGNMSDFEELVTKMHQKSSLLKL